MELQDILRQLPKMNDLLIEPAITNLLQEHPRAIVVEALRSALEQLRQQMLDGQATTVKREELLEHARLLIVKSQERHLKKVINGTGIIVHTNLGRSNLSQKAIAAVTEAAGAYSNLEYDLHQGERGERYSHVDKLLCDLLGCESALVVNNNAAAVLLTLSTLGNGKEAIVSRGELVEIGGSFRIPEVIQQGGCILREIGATNRTHLRDYEQAIGENTALILKVHTSNYRILGFTSAVPLTELKTLTERHNLPLVEDMGSGLLIELTRYGLADEPTVQASVQAGVDVITFSGDKLLGGPQAGLIVGGKRYIDQMKKHPLTRALRIDKMTLAALEATLLHYRDEIEALRQIPTLQMIALTPDELRSKAEQLAALLQATGIPAQIVATTSQVGGGALPTQQLASWAVTLTPDGYSPDQIETLLRTETPPIIGRIVKNRYLLDVRTLDEQDFSIIQQQTQTLLN